MKVIVTIRVAGLLLFVVWAETYLGHAARPFGVLDAIRTAHFGDPYWGTTAPLLFSPDGKFFVADVERGVPETNRPESTLRVYRVEDIRGFLKPSGRALRVSPYFELTKSTYQQGTIISQIRWLRDSSGFAFLLKSSLGYDQLFLVELKTKKAAELTPDRGSVVDFDVRDKNHYVYSLKSPAILETATRNARVAGFVGTGHPLRDLIFLVDKHPWLLMDSHKINYDLKELWAVVDGKRRRIEDKSSGRPLPLHWTSGARALALSPDGNSVVTVMAVKEVPQTWRTQYPPPFPSDPDIAPPGPQDINAVDGVLLGSEYVLIDLSEGKIKSLTGAPTGYSEGWRSNEVADWSADGKWVALSDSFIPRAVRDPLERDNYPCVTVVSIDTGGATCVLRLRGQGEGNSPSSWRYIEDITFDQGSNSRLYVQYNSKDEPQNAHVYTRRNGGEWMPTAMAAPNRVRPITVSIAQGLSDPPVLVARDQVTSLSRVIWDPNPQLKEVDLGRVSVLKWKDKAGQAWIGGLYLPAGYNRTQAYPLVVQTHGFMENEFRAEGIYPTAFAARALAAAGIAVLQVPDCQIRFTSEEGACQVAGYESGIDELVSMGVADPNHVGIIGFSRTCYAVLETLTTSRLHFAAASITDGLNMGYLQYLQYLDEANGFYTRDAEVANRAAPFGDGLLKWFALSPEFNLHKIASPLQVVALGADSVLEMWEPYAALRSLHRPVDLIVLGDGTHNLSNPEQRLASQQGTVDWFRFWLQGYEDADPSKAAQYVRWRGLRALEEPRHERTAGLRGETSHCESR